MILRHFWPLLFAVTVIAADDFDCKVYKDSLTYDLTKLKGPHELTHTRESPPSKFHDVLWFDLCQDLPKKDGVKEHDQCPAGTRACLTITNEKKDEPDRVVAVIQLALASASNVTYTPLTDDKAKGITLTFNGPPYPSESETTPQTLKVTITCVTDEEKGDPVFSSYDGHQASVTWKSTAGCGFKGLDGGDKDDKDDKGSKDDGGTKVPEEVGSGIGWFFLMVLLVLGAYFGIGAYYNYATYGARGIDLIPHRDFWMEVPYMMQDLLSHLCSVIRPRTRRATNRGGYISV